MKATDVARKAFSACFVISADSTRTTSMGGDKGANSFLIRSASRFERTPRITRSGFVNASMALPSLRFSGLLANVARPDGRMAAYARSR